MSADVATPSGLSFDLAHEPWIPCIAANGAAGERSLRDVIACAHEIKEIADPSPLVTIALYRFVLAVIHRALADDNGAPWPRERADCAALWDAGRFPADRIDAYFDRQSADHRFDLFGRQAFYQTPTATFAKAPAPIERIVIGDRASNTRPAIFDKTVRRSLTPAEAARHLVTLHGFALGGLSHVTEGGSGARGPLAFGALFLARSESAARPETLFATLLSNLVIVDSRGLGSSDQRPAWERDDAVVTDSAYVPHGYLDLLTHQSRVVQLTPEVALDGTVLVTGVHIGPGRTIAAAHKAAANGETVDSRGMAIGELETTMMLRQGEGKPPFRMSMDRAMWSTAHTLYAAAETKPSRQLGVVAHVYALEEVIDEFLPDGVVSLEAFGVTLKNGGGAVDGWRRERLPLIAPGANGAARQAARGAVEEAIGEAERVSDALERQSRTFARDVVTRGRTDTKAAKQANEVVAALGGQRDYWAALAIAFPVFVARLARAVDDVGDLDLQAIADDWTREVHGTATRAFSGVLERLAADGRHWHARDRPLNTTTLARAEARLAFQDALQAQGAKRR